MSKLSKSEFEATFDGDIELAGSGYSPCLDFWHYVDALSEDDKEGYDCDYVSDYIFFNDTRGIEHVMLRTDSPDHYLTIVIDKARKQVLGHHLFHADFEAPDWLMELNPARSKS